ncbi:MAG: hypothetical protein QME74_04650 [Candidatus Edwardsbacteria bacterium]|nr:hypothetical protein [Candidatus Edwardsbacteria bacterium]
MRTDAVIKTEGFQALRRRLDKVEAERFIALLKREGFDYTQWRKPLWEDISVRELSRRAMEKYGRE